MAGGKIAVIGGSALREPEIRRIARNEGIDPKRIECCLDYKSTKNYNYQRLRNCRKYQAVLVGPIVHSASGKGCSSSLITALETGKDYPTVIRLESGNTLRITKNNLTNALRSLRLAS